MTRSKSFTGSKYYDIEAFESNTERLNAKTTIVARIIKKGTNKVYYCYSVLDVYQKVETVKQDEKDFEDILKIMSMIEIGSLNPVICRGHEDWEPKVVRGDTIRLKDVIWTDLESRVAIEAEKNSLKKVELKTLGFTFREELPHGSWFFYDRHENRMIFFQRSAELPISIVKSIALDGNRDARKMMMIHEIEKFLMNSTVFSSGYKFFNPNEFERQFQIRGLRLNETFREDLEYCYDIIRGEYQLNVHLSKKNHEEGIKDRECPLCGSKFGDDKRMIADNDLQQRFAELFNKREED